MVIEREQHRYWESIAGQRPPQHPVCWFFSQQRWQYVQRVVDWQHVSSVCDVGSGRGMATAVLENDGLRLAGIDFSAQQLRANPVATMQKAVARGDGLPFTSAQFDLVTCWELLHHASDPAQVIGEMVRLSREWVVIFEPNMLNPAQFLFSLLVPEERGSLTLYCSLIEEALAHHDCEVLRFRRVGWILPNRCPRWLFALLRRLPFVLPMLGISRLWIARKRVP
jgi:SAM-dependent methyltransferase